GLSRLLTVGAFQDGSFVFGKAGALEQQRTDLALELAFRPVAFETFVFVERALEWVVNADKFKDVCPGEMKDGFGRKRRYTKDWPDSVWPTLSPLVNLPVACGPERGPILSPVVTESWPRVEDTLVKTSHTAKHGHTQAAKSPFSEVVGEILHQA